jgi:hypothetical protein
MPSSGASRRTRKRIRKAQLDKEEPRRTFLAESPLYGRSKKFGEGLSQEPVCGTARSGYEVAEEDR